MIKGVSLGETEVFVCKDDDPSNPTKWRLGVIDSLAMSEIQDLITVFEPDQSGRPDAPTKTKLCLNLVRTEAVRHGLKGWENFVDFSGTQVPFKTERRHIGGKTVDVVCEDILRTIPYSVINEIGDRILAKNRFSEADAKN